MLASAYLLMDQSSLGFPDGGLTELERAQKPLFQIYSVGQFALAMTFALIGIKWNPESKFWRVCFWVGLVIFLASWVGFAWINYWWAGFLRDGGGG